MWSPSAAGNPKLPYTEPPLSYRHTEPATTSIKSHNGIDSDGAYTWITSSQQCTLQICPLSLAHTCSTSAATASTWPSSPPHSRQVYCEHSHQSMVIHDWYGLRSVAGVGHAARIQVRGNPFIDRWFTCKLSRSKYMVCLTITPAFLRAANYVSFARIVAVYTKRISDQEGSYSLIIVACDILFLLLEQQVAQSRLAMTVPQYRSNQHHDRRASIQVGSLTLYLVICLKLAWRIYQLPFQSDGLSQPDGFLQDFTWVAFLIFQGLATACIYRSMFRIETIFIGLEGAMISIAAIALSAWGHRHWLSGTAV
ncbi:hypothetical protein BDV09DRAFT_182670 [Aspergillus tetrazonus]